MTGDRKSNRFNRWLVPSCIMAGIVALDFLPEAIFARETKIGLANYKAVFCTLALVLVVYYFKHWIIDFTTSVPIRVAAYLLILFFGVVHIYYTCLLYTSPSPRD